MKWDKNNSIHPPPLPIHAICEIWYTSEESLFEAVDDDGWTTMDACLFCKLIYEPSVQVS